MPWYPFAVDGTGNLGLCSAHASCTAGANIFALPRDEVLNTVHWVETRRALLARDTTVPGACRGCYTLNDPWRREV